MLSDQKIRILIFISCAGNFKPLLLKKAKEYFPNAEIEKSELKNGGVGIPSFEALCQYDVVFLGVHGNSLRKATQQRIGDLLVRLLEETPTAVITSMWVNEMNSSFGLGGKWRSENWNPVNTNFSSKGYSSGRKLKYLVPNFESFPDLKEYRYNAHYGGLNEHRKVRVIAEWIHHGHTQKMYGIVELVRYKSLQLNYHPSNRFSDEFYRVSADIILKSIHYMHNRPKIVGTGNRVLEKKDLEERIEFLIQEQEEDDGNGLNQITVSIGNESSDSDKHTIPKIFMF